MSEVVLSFSTLTVSLEGLVGLVFLLLFCLFLIALYAEERGAAFTNERRALQRLEREAALLVPIDSKSRAALNRSRSPNGHLQ
jgi:Ca2+/Na+ antiporter